MKPFSKKNIKADILGDPVTPYEQAEERGSQEVSIYSPEYEFLKKLINVVVKQGVPAQEIKDLSLKAPFQTVDDVGNLAAQIWTLATEKYHIPREWLMKKLPEKKGNLKHADLWPSQEAASEGTITQGPGQIAYNPNQEKDTSVSGPNPNDKISSPNEFSIYQDFVNDSFYHKGNRWSAVVKELKNLYPQITDEEIAKLKQDVKYKLNQSHIQLESKKKTLNIDTVVQMLNKKEPKVIHVDIKNMTLELQDGTILSFDEAIKSALEMDKESVFSGAEFSTNDVGVNPSLDSGPFSSPQDQGAGDQEQPFPNTNWVPADDENKDEQPWSNIASSLKKKALENPMCTCGHRNGFHPVSKEDKHSPCKVMGCKCPSFFPDKKQAVLKKKAAQEFTSEVSVDIYGKGELLGHKEIGSIGNVNIKWQFELEMREWGVKNVYVHVPDQQVQLTYDYWKDESVVGAADDGYIQEDKVVAITNVQCTGLDHASWDSVLTPQTLEYNSGKWTVDFGNYRTASLSKKELKKKAALSGQVINEILNNIENKVNVTYNFSNCNLSGSDNYAVSIFPYREKIVDLVDFDTIEGYLIDNEELLADPSNSFGAWSHDGKVYLDVVATTSDKEKAIELGKSNNQLAIWDLKNNQEIPLEIKAFSKKDLIKTSKEQILTQEQQDQIAASTSPVYNIALTNYAEAIKRGHDKDRSIAYAIDSVKNVEKIDEKKLVELINNYL